MMSKNISAALALALGATPLMAPVPALANQFGQGGMMGQGPRMMEMMFDFAATDANGDGKVTQAEIQARRQAEIAAMDADADGLISQAELATFIGDRMQKMAERIAAERISTQDSDSDGKLSAGEMQIPSMPGRMFERLDSDGDGALSEAEIDAMRKRMAERGGHGKSQHGKHGWFGWGDAQD